MNDSEYLSLLTAAWKRVSLVAEPGLSIEELGQIESRYAIRFPPDLRACLQCAVPVDQKFPDWRRAASGRFHNADRALRESLAWPLDGILFDVEHNEFWPEALGVRPGEPESRRNAISAWYSSAPRLIPIYSHRYICEEPHALRNAVVSVYQTDIVYYGVNLLNYLQREFFGHRNSTTPVRGASPIRFWSSIIDNA